MSATLDVRTVRRRFLILRGLRWLPTGLVLPVLVLLLTSRGLSLTEVGVVVAAQGLLVLLLELPTGGLADTIGRRPVLLLATLFEIASLGLLVATGDLLLLVVAFALQGVYRALESGPLDSWFVDATLVADPDADIERGLAGGGAVLGGTMAVGSLTAGVLVATEPFGAALSLTLPVLVAIVVRLAEFVAVLTLVVEPVRDRVRRGMRASTAEVVTTIRSVGSLARRSTPLLALLAAEGIWGLTAATYELLPPVRLAELTGSADRAAALMGPASAVAWSAVATGSALVPRLSRRLGPARAATACRVLHGAAIVATGAATGSVGVLVAYVVTFGAHGATNVPYATLLHRQADATNRTTLLSTASMLGMSAGSIGGILLGALADTTSTATAMIAGGLALAGSAPLFQFVHRRDDAPRGAGGPAADAGADEPCG